MDIYELLDIEIKKSMLRSEDYDATELQKLLDIVYDNIYECRDDDAIRKSLSKLSSVFHAIGDNTVVVLVFVLINKLNNLNGIKIQKHSHINAEIDFDKLTSYIKSDIVINHGQFNFLKHRKGNTSLGKKKLYATILSMLKEYLRNTDKENDDITIIMILLSALNHLLGRW